MNPKTPLAPDQDQQKAQRALIAMCMCGLLVLSCLCAMLLRSSSIDAAFDSARARQIARTVDINHADVPLLTALPEIGPAMAKRIVDDRAVNGTFFNMRDLDRVRGIGPRTCEQLAASGLVRFRVNHQ